MEKIYKAGTKVIFFLHTGYCGMDGYEFYELERDYTESRLVDEAWLMAVQHAENYGIYPPSGYDGWDEEEEESLSGENIEGSFQVYIPEKHKGYSFDGKPEFSKL